MVVDAECSVLRATKVGSVFCYTQMLLAFQRRILLNNAWQYNILQAAAYVQPCLCKSCMAAHGVLLQDWLVAYDSCPSSDRAAFGRSGLLQQALVLEMDSDRFNALQVRTLGWSGQLPMLDLYYLIKRLSESGPGLQLSQVWMCNACPCLSYFAANCSSACSSTCLGRSFLRMSNKGLATHVTCIGPTSLYISLSV